MFGRNARLRRYDRTLQSLDLRAQDSLHVVDKLAELWQRFRVSDFTGIPLSVRHAKEIAVYHSCVVELSTALLSHNQNIKDQADGVIERYIATHNWSKHNIVLDLYLADEQHRTIDEKQALRRLQGAIMEHRYLVRKQETQYYQRLSEPFYSDIITLTKVLVDSSLLRS